MNYQYLFATLAMVAVVVNPSYAHTYETRKYISSLWNHLSSQAYLWYLPLGSICTDHFVLTSLKPPPQVFMLGPSNSSNHCFLYLSFGDRDLSRSMQHGTSSSGEDIFGWKPCSNSPGSHPEKKLLWNPTIAISNQEKHIVYHIVSQLFTKQSTCIPIEWFSSMRGGLPGFKGPKVLMEYRHPVWTFRRALR